MSEVQTPRRTDADNGDAVGDEHPGPGELAALVGRAEAAEEEALAVAARARSRAQSIRRLVEPSGGENDSAELAEPGRVRARGRRRWLLAGVLAVLCSVVMLTASGYLVWTHRQIEQQMRNQAEFEAAAKQAVVTLMSIDFNDPRAAVRRIAENSTDPFRAELLGAADDFVKMATDAKVTTTAMANTAAVKSATSESAVVLVAASSTVTDAAGAQQAPRNWRLSVGLERDGDRIKMSSVDFLP